MRVRWNKVLPATIAGLMLLAILAACTPAATTAPEPTTAPPAEVTAPPAAEATEDPMAALIAAAQAEGMLSTIALPRDWCNYGEVIDSFTAKYGLEYNGLLPDGGSGDEIEAIKANQGNTGPQAPDVIDVGFAFGPSSQAEGLLLPYKVATWDTIPESAKDPDGNWYGDYYGVMSFMVNKDIVENVPQDWADLLKPEYKSRLPSPVTRASRTRPFRQCLPLPWPTAEHSIMPNLALTSSRMSTPAGTLSRWSRTTAWWRRARSPSG
jgi:putative spermidine/putrescine transport system substrate-binding protein